MEKAVASILSCGIVIVLLAYQVGGKFFWPIHDFGRLLFPIAFLMLVKNSLLLSSVGWVWFGGQFNSLSVALFGDVTKFDLGQKVSLAVVSVGIIICGLISAHRAHKRKVLRDQACKRNARKQYKEIRSRVETMEKRIDTYDHALERFINDLITIQ